MHLQSKFHLSSKRTRFLVATVITTVSGVLVTSAVIAGVTFKGQGTVEFDKVKTNTLTVKTASNFMGELKNTTSGKPLKVADSLKVTGSSDFAGILQNKTSGMPLTVGDDLGVTGRLVVAGTSRLLGDLDVDGSLTAGNVSAIEENVALNRAKLIVWHDYLECVVTMAQYTTYSESADLIFCWNTYVAGGEVLPPLAGEGQEGTRPSDAVLHPETRERSLRAE